MAIRRWMNVVRGVVAAGVVVGVSEIGTRLPRLGTLLLTLPIVSLVAFVTTWNRDRDLRAIAGLAGETLILVPLGLPFFVPLARAPRLGLGFWSAFVIGLMLASATIRPWFWLGPKPA